MNSMIIVLILFAIGAMGLVVLYNGLIGKRNNVDEALGDVDAMLRKRFDLIPNLVGAVDRYMEHERDVLQELTALRARATGGDLSMEERASMDRATTGLLGRLMIAVEAYPELKANQNFLQLQESLNEVEEQLNRARRSYNAVVTVYNNATEMFPSNLVAGLMSLRRRAYFEVDDTARQTPDVASLFGAGGRS